MMIWIIIFSLAITDIAYSHKYLHPAGVPEKLIPNWLLLFFINYIPLALFGYYNSDISDFLNSSGYSWLANNNLEDLLRPLWALLIDFLQYSSILYFFSFWISVLISLSVMTYSSRQRKKANRSGLFAMYSSFFFLLYNVSAEQNEYLFLYGVMIAIYLLTWIKIKYTNYWMRELYDIMAKYNILVFINTIVAMKRILYFSSDNFNFFWNFCSLSGIIFTFICFFFPSHDDIYRYLETVWRELKEKRKTCFHAEENEWKVCKAYGFIVIFAYFMYLTNNLIEIWWKDVWLLREVLFITGSEILGEILIYPEGDECLSSYLSQVNLNWISVYCQTWAIRKVINIIF